MRTRWADSADKHGIEHADAAHAMRNAKIRLYPFDTARVEGKPAVWLFIGPNRDDSVMLEVLAHREPDSVEVFHVMPLRRSVLERARQMWEAQQEGK